MKTSNCFFVIQNVDQGDNGNLQLAGQFIINGATEINGTDEVADTPDRRARGNEPKATIEIAHMFQVKWVLPPKGSVFYESVKGFAESMEYETVENGDFSYPAR